MKKLVLLTTLFAAILSGCGNGNKYVNEQQIIEKYTFEDAKTSVTIIKPYKEMIKDKLYYISHEKNKGDFIYKYEYFLKENEHRLDVIDTAIDPNEDSYNSVDGYFIFTKLKENK